MEIGLKLLTTLTALTAWSCAATPDAGDNGPYPIWWSPSLELESLDRIDERLQRKFWPDDEEGMPVYKGEWPGDDQVFVESCASYQELKKQGYYARFNQDSQVLLFHSATCRAIEMLAEAKPSKTSYVRSLALNADAFEVLPAMVNLAASCDFLCRQYLANERRIPWGRFEVSQLVSVEVIHDNRMKVRFDTENLTLDILARADFSGIGIEDLVLRVDANATEGTWGMTDLLLLTRDIPDSVLWVLDAEKGLCRDYKCQPYYDYPEALREVD